MRSLQPLCWLCFLLAPRCINGVGRVVPVLHGLHLNDLLRDTRTERPATLLAIYTTDPKSPCAKPSKGTIANLGQGEGLPSRAHLLIGKHDNRALDDIWWDWHSDSGSERYDFFHRYNLSRCPAFVFFPAVDQEEDFYEPRRDMLLWEGAAGQPASWREWLHDALQRNVTLSNAMSVVVQVRVSSYSSEFGAPSTFDMQPGEKREVQITTAGLLEASWSVDSEDPRVRWRRAVRGNGGLDCQFLVIDKDQSSDNFAAHRKEQQALSDRDTLLNERDQSTTFQHSAINKQPPVMPTKGVKESYKVVDMPVDLLEQLITFYRKYEHLRKSENLPPTHTGINGYVVETTMVSFDENMRERDRLASEVVRPLVEEWVKTPLEFTALYGIREYYRGAELRMHVDRVKSHVFSVIFNIMQEGMDEEWLLEVIDFDGQRRKVPMKAGQMIFYQSAKLVHGRPEPLRGDRYVNAFCHFRPAEGWEFDYRAGDMLYRDGQPFIDYKVD